MKKSPTSRDPEENEVSEEDQVMLKAYEDTRKSLIERLGNWEDQKSWDEFYKRYWKLIYSVALKSGLRSEEALDAVQETIFVIAKQQKEHRYDPKMGSFKSWLMNQTRLRIADQFPGGAILLPRHRKEFARGLFMEKTNWPVYVNRGVGALSPRFRIASPPEITLMNLKNIA